MTEQHVLEFYLPDFIYLQIQIKMADEEMIEKVLELYQICKSRGDRASLFMETMNGKDITVNFTIKCPAGPQPAGTGSSSRRRWKTPSQLRRDKERKEKFLAKKLENSTEEEKEAKIVKEPQEDVSTEEKVDCEKVLVVPSCEIKNSNIGIEYDVTKKLEAKGVKVKKVKVERTGDPIFGVYVRSEVTIEPADAKLFKKDVFEIENCWVLPCI